MEFIEEPNEALGELLLEKIDEEFHDDPIYQQVNSFHLTNKLFEDLSLVESIDFSKLYSTKEATAFLGEGVKEHRLTNTLGREKLFPYFQVERKGAANRYVYDWRAILRFKMIFLLVDQENLKLVDIEKLLSSSGISKVERNQKIGDLNTPIFEGHKVEVIIVSKTLDELRKEIEENKKSFLTAINEMKEVNSQRERDLFSSLSEVLIQEYSHQDEYLETLREHLETYQTAKKSWRRFFNWRNKEEAHEEMVESIKSILDKRRRLLSLKMMQLKSPMNTSLSYSLAFRNRVPRIWQK